MTIAQAFGIFLRWLINFNFHVRPGAARFLALFCLIACFAQAVTVFAVDTLTVYSGRSERLIKPVLDEFTSKTGIQVDLLSSGTTELVNRLKAEGDRTPADLFLTNDAGSLEQRPGGGDSPALEHAGSRPRDPATVPRAG